jgi:CubicO group peptidase (beta-lactamase class C family)
MKYSFILVFLCCLTCSNAQETLDQSHLVESIKDKVKKTDFPKGVQLAIGIIKEDQRLVVGMEKSIRWREIQNEQRIFEIGSITKVLTSMLLSTAVSNGVVTLEDTIQNDWDIEWKIDQPITYKMLANHTSGLPRIPSNIMQYIAKNPDNPYVDYNEKDLREYLEEYAYLESDPGEKYAYSNLGVGLLAHVLCKKWGISFEQALHTYLFMPLDMVDSSTERSKLKQEPVIGMNNKGEQTSFWDFEVLAGAGAIKSTVFDLLRFMQFQLYDEGEVVKRIQQQTFEAEPYNLGLGWHITKEGWLWHNGGTGGFTSSLALNTQNNQGVVILTNIAPDHPDSKIIDQLVFELLAELSN